MKALLFALVLALASAGVVLGQDAPKAPSPATGAPRKGAASADWLLGKWTFDAEYTQKKYAEAKPAEGLKKMQEGMVYPQLLEGLKGSHVNFTEKELIMTTKDGNGKAFPYEVMEAVENKSVTLKQTDGEVSTYHKEGEDRFWMASTGNVNIPFYFKRAE